MTNDEAIEMMSWTFSSQPWVENGYNPEAMKAALESVAVHGFALAPVGEVKSIMSLRWPVGQEMPDTDDLPTLTRALFDAFANRLREEREGLGGKDGPR